MRIGILSYPMLFQREGGLQIQVRETISALNQLGFVDGRPVQAELVDTSRQRLAEFDLIHVFSAINGNYRVLEAATDMGVPVVLSPLLAPCWNRVAGFRARVVERLAARLTAWQVQTSYAQTKRALQLADRVIALGEPERKAIVDGFLADPAKIRIFPNGIGARFFDAGPETFRQRTGLAGPFVLSAGAISPYKNQLGLAAAMEGLELPLVLAGRVAREDQAYLRNVLQSPWVRWLGELDHGDPLLASAFRAASVVALPSQGEIFPLAVLEALAAGTPVVMTAESALELEGSSFALEKVRWDDLPTQRAALRRFASAPPDRKAVRTLVEPYTWQRVANQIAGCYLELLAQARGR
jgi:glycosyltransferase involved in cell wall biosynthesis